jgi:hypothetical protein
MNAIDNFNATSDAWPKKADAPHKKRWSSPRRLL